MGRAFAEIAFTPSVNAAQELYGSREVNSRFEAAADRFEVLTALERKFVEERDGFYQATTSETGWPYVQYRGGRRGFLKVLDARTLGFADFRGNVQYLSVGNINADGRVALILMDYPERRRLKIWGRASIVHRKDQPGLLDGLADASYKAVVERGIIIDVLAFDWNCPQHITPRYTETEVRNWAKPLLAELDVLRDSLRSKTDRSSEALGEGALKLMVSAIRLQATDVLAYELRTLNGELLPAARAGSHIALPVRPADGPQGSRNYYIASDTADRTRWEVAVKRELNGTGGSIFINEYYRVGMELGLDAPSSGFRLLPGTEMVILIAGGLGIAPLMALAFSLRRQNRSFQLHYEAHSAREAPYLEKLKESFPLELRNYWSADGLSTAMNVASIVLEAPPNAVLFVCGPERLIKDVEAEASRAGIPNHSVHYERILAS